MDVGKGANTVISLLHHFFETHGLGEKHVHLHADNCVGQNKNNTMMHYLAWRVIHGLHDSIKLSFMLVRHTKFSPDACFGLLKRRFQRTKVDCLDDIVAVVRSSADVNKAQLVGTQGGTPIVQIFDWVDFFSTHMKKIPLITQQHHFEFSVESPGVVSFRKSSDSSSRAFKLTSDTAFHSSDLPQVITPRGLTTQRKWYLWDKIREFCSEETKGVVCPTPEEKAVEHPQTSSEHGSPSLQLPSLPSVCRQQKRSRCCSICGAPGHKRKCPVEDLD